MQKAITQGGLFAMAEPRGSGKTARCEGSALYAILYGFQKFVLLIGSSTDAALELLSSIKSELEQNELLLEDFPEAVFPIRALGGEPRRCKGQTYGGKNTLSQWSSDVIVFPRIPNSAASSAIIRVAGITARVRGMKFKRPDGESVRPTFVIPDDVQTDASANSESQCRTRERTLAGAVLGLAGPGKKIAGVMPCTVIRAGDVADRMLDKSIHPEWDGSRFKLMYDFPKNQNLWDKYREIFVSFDPAVVGDKERAAKDATEFYRSNREAMDEGAKIAWPERFDPDEISAIQHAMNLKFRDERAFYAEYQNEPLLEERGDFIELAAEQVAGKINRHARWEVPDGVSTITAMIDVQGEVLFYVVAGWSDDFTGYILDYGTYPDQRKSYFTLQDLTKTLATATGVQGFEGQLYKGLDTLTTHLSCINWKRCDGTLMKIDRCLIDARWGDSTDIVYQICKQSVYSAILMPSFGKGVGASTMPLTTREKKPGERFGLNWIVTTANKRSRTHLLYDTNFWKSFTTARFHVEMGNPGCVSLFGDTPNLHRMYADHMTSEYRVKVEGRGRSVDEWKLTPGRRNDWFDCTVGCAVAASMMGVGLEKVHATTKPKIVAAAMTLEEMKQASRNKGR